MVHRSADFVRHRQATDGLPETVGLLAVSDHDPATRLGAARQRCRRDNLFDLFFDFDYFGDDLFDLFLDLDHLGDDLLDLFFDHDRLFDDLFDLDHRGFRGGAAGAQQQGNHDQQTEYDGKTLHFIPPS